MCKTAAQLGGRGKRKWSAPPASAAGQTETRDGHGVAVALVAACAAAAARFGEILDCASISGGGVTERERRPSALPPFRPPEGGCVTEGGGGQNGAKMLPHHLVCQIESFLLLLAPSSVRGPGWLDK